MLLKVEGKIKPGHQTMNAAGENFNLSDRLSLDYSDYLCYLIIDPWVGDWWNRQIDRHAGRYEVEKS